MNATTTPPVTYRPDWSHFWSKAKARLIFIPVAFLLGGYRLGGAFIPVVIATIAIAGIGLWLYLRTTRLTVSDSAVSRRRWGRTTTVELDGSQRGILCTLNLGVQNLAYLTVRDGKGRRIVLTEANWPGEQLRAIAQHARLTIMPADQVFSGKKAAQVVPGVIPITTRRPVLCALVALVALLAVIVPFAVVVAGAA
ncbi:hypothetical protein [Frigoribacterium sp. Leaf186]|uniref:hypothetical protein n=1 Tax=Frigoribacterium sp. Leaf186 TaxID=1736293 RepID=UPI0006FDF51D|nr:hypothetical protein [Frigoribacterium sp. Leaf186]KQS17295.1 hypothetical protein ASG05_07225 [Frigoribacterium sp. Leaf186]